MSHVVLLIGFEDTNALKGKKWVWPFFSAKPVVILLPVVVQKINWGRRWAKMRILQNGCILTILIWQNVLKGISVNLLIYFFQSRHFRIVSWTAIHRGTADAVIPITWSVSSHVWDVSVVGVTLKCKPRFVVLEGAWNLKPTQVFLQ